MELDPLALVYRSADKPPLATFFVESAGDSQGTLPGQNLDRQPIGRNYRSTGRDASHRRFSTRWQDRSPNDDH
jgi:hypothetical protein